MTRRARVLLVSLAALAAVAVSGCGNKEEVVRLGETEGIYVTVDGLKYQIQISRLLDPASPEDSAYLKGLPETEQLADDEIWYGIFMRVENDGDDPHPMAENYVIHDTEGNEFEPIELDEETNSFLYQPRELQAGTLAPQPNAPAFDNTIRGELILFKVNASSLGNRPLELEIESPSGGENAIIDIDV